MVTINGNNTLNGIIFSGKRDTIHIMIFNIITTYTHYFKNLLDPETFVRLQELLEPPSKFSKMTDDDFSNIMNASYKLK